MKILKHLVLLSIVFFISLSVNASVSKEEVKTYYTASLQESNSGTYLWREGRFIIVKGKCEGQYADYLMLKEVSKLLLQNIGLPNTATLPANISKTITPVSVERKQSVENSQLHCKIVDYYHDKQLKVDITKQQKQQYLYQFYASTLMNNKLTSEKKVDLFQQAEMVDIANILSISRIIHDGHQGDIIIPTLETDWIDANSDHNNQLKQLFSQVGAFWFTADKGDTGVVSDYLLKANDAYQKGEANNFIGYATIILSRNPKQADIWTKLAAVFRSSEEYQLSKACLYYAMAIKEISAYPLMTLAVTNFRLGDKYTAKPLASLSYFLDSDTEWVKNNYEMIIHEDK
ncbi:hypothetical protein [Shewanella sp. UCD-KL12]|uniref:hypothetical protein n=1 Tax=Shewanella sp. UCD-KL12 TaxID=1917163 RepID=UPI000970ACDC|nr:hypothetical protein [Shewanella sp. UCD-KL12]